jgi:hypothetical protein
LESKNLKILNLWIELQERGIVVEDVAVDVNSCTLDMDDFRQDSQKTRKKSCVGLSKHSRKALCLIRGNFACIGFKTVYFI